jgi:hypothetical protein
MEYAVEMAYVSWRLVQAPKQYWSFTSEILGAVMVVLLMGGIYELRHWDGVGCYDIPSFMKIGSGIQKLIGEIHMQIHRQQGDRINLLLVLQNKESRLRIKLL